MCREGVSSQELVVSDVACGFGVFRLTPDC